MKLRNASFYLADMLAVSNRIPVRKCKVCDGVVPGRFQMCGNCDRARRREIKKRSDARYASNCLDCGTKTSNYRTVRCAKCHLNKIRPLRWLKAV